MRLAKNNILYLLLIFFLISFNKYLYTQTWWHAYRNPGEIYQFGYDICKSNGDNFFIVGKKEASQFARINVIKINEYGSVLWSKFYADSIENGHSAFACESTNDGGCILSGWSNDNIPFAKKIDSSGNIVWSKIYENHNIYDRTVQIIKTTDDCYVLCGLDYILKINSEGEYIWSKSDNELGYTGDIYSVVETFDNGFICLGYQYLSSYPTLTKLKNNGGFVWQKTYTNRPASVSLIRKLSYCYLLMGNIADSVPYPNTNYKYYFAKIDTAGNEISYHSGFDSTGKIESFNRGYHVLNDNRFIFTSIDYTNIANDSVTFTNIKIVDSVGNIVHKKIIEHIHWGCHEVYSVLPLNDGYIMYVGTSRLSIHSINRAVFMARSDTTLYIDPVGVLSNHTIIPERYSLSQNFPNPFNPVTNIKYDLPKDVFVTIKIYDLLGRKIKTLVSEFKRAGSYLVSFNGSELASGVYIYGIQAGDFIRVKRMVLIK